MKNMLVAALALALLLPPTGAAVAAETGMAGMHSWVRVGGRTCMLDHYHDGSGSGATQAAARTAAIRAWVDFTAWEYGSSWGRYSLAISKSMKCDRGIGGGWSCHTSARPCRSR